MHHTLLYFVTTTLFQHLLFCITDKKLNKVVKKIMDIVTEISTVQFCVYKCRICRYYTEVKSNHFNKALVTCI